MEHWDLYDINKNKTGKTIKRGVTLPQDRYHLVIHFWIKNRKGEFLIQKRSNSVELNKGLWSFTGGSALAGETSEQAVVREVIEEIGYSINPTEISVIHHYFRRDYWVDVYLLEKDVPLHAFNMGVEVETVKYVNMEEILKMKSAGFFYNLDDIYFEKLFCLHQ